MCVDYGFFVSTINIEYIIFFQGCFLRRLCLIVLVFWVGVCAVGVTALGADATAAESNGARQLRIYKSGLLSGSTDQDREDAAIELLLRPEKDARAILISAINSTGNPAGRRAVCMALIKSRAWSNSIRTKSDFIPGLFTLLGDSKSDDVKLAAEALLIFDYREISSRLGAIARGKGKVSQQARINAIEALKLWPDREAISELVKLIDDDDKQVASAAEGVLIQWVPMFSDREEWKVKLRELQRKKASEIVRDRMIAQEAEIRRLEANRDMWQKLCLGEMDREYERADETARGQLLAKRLGSDFVEIRLWALNKISHRSPGTIFTAEFDKLLLSLIADPDRVIRHETAKVLAKMSGRNPGEKLLAQFKVEEFADVRLAIFEALGEACYFAFSPGSGVELAPSVRDETLKIAGGYLASDDYIEAKKGAEVTGKLLKVNGLEAKVTDEYLAMLAARYNTAYSEDDESLEGELLSEMAKLCGQDSNCRVKAVKVFQAAFTAGLVNGNDNTREAAIAGLINADKQAAMMKIRSTQLYNDGSAAVRGTVVELASEMGTGEDLGWLVEKLGANGAGEVAWQAMMEILRRQKAVVSLEWAGKVTGGNGGRVQMLLEMAERKAEGEGDASVLLAVRLWLLDIYLDESDAEMVSEIVAKRIRENGDIGIDDEVIAKIDAFFNSSEDDKVKVTVIEALGAIELEGEHSNWDQVLAGWRKKAGASL
jgi:HEAT repeat protein